MTSQGTGLEGWSALVVGNSRPQGVLPRVWSVNLHCLELPYTEHSNATQGTAMCAAQ